MQESKWPIQYNVAVISQIKFCVDSLLWKSVFLRWSKDRSTMKTCIAKQPQITHLHVKDGAY